jgi:hypothetical protein
MWFASFLAITTPEQNWTAGSYLQHFAFQTVAPII